MHLKRARIAILPVAALASAGVTIWVDSLHGINVGRDDLCPAVLTIILSVWALVNAYYRKFWDAAGQLRLTVLAEGVSAAMREQAGGNGEAATQGRPGGAASSPQPRQP